MGKSRYRVYDNRYPHFVTSTFIRWIPLFSFPQIATICIDSIKYLQVSEEFTLYGWVFMENHFHLIARSPNLSKSIGRMKSFTGRKIIEYLQRRNHQALLEELTFRKKFHKQLQDFQVWQEGSHPEQISDRKTMVQKLNYIHNNPVKRCYVERSEYWLNSSARDYLGENGLLDICKSW